jgi:uncharacterized protein (DUF2461 family)
MLEDLRKTIAAKPKEFLKLIADTEKATGIPISAELYKRPKTAPTEALAPYFAWKGKLACVVDEPVSEAVFGPELGSRAEEFLTKLIPLYEYLCQFSD